MQGGLVLLAGATLFSLMSMAIDPWVVTIVILGLCLLGVLLALYRAVLIRRRRRLSAPFENELTKSAGAVPQSVSDVAARARLDELRTKFERGLSKFKAHGKDLYSLPWYVYIGEPGSGKTEAIRHCGIGFPPGLQDELQGSGGTINMDWWFTDRAVILDTAGRLTFAEVDSTDSEEWCEFLRLLKRYRVNYPINGLMIAIPVDSLIQDDAGEIERKAGQLARQLDLIQRTLGVRFPVIITVTKADKLTGFRRFFGDLRDPKAQGQMIGWSNPAPLDEPFQPRALEQHLQSVQRGLLRRRTGLLQSMPAAHEAEDGRRIDAVDELYAFPEALSRVASRLQRYLELIFVAGEWTSKPLFLRGIYFTSSMQHGEALDQELAEALRVPVESLQEAAWAESRAYFLRDVFLEKVFEEKGLVTSAANARSQQRKRRLALYGTGGAAASIFGLLTVSGCVGYKEEIARRVDFWTRLAEQDRDFRRGGGLYWQVVERDERNAPRYVGTTRELKWFEPPLTLAQFFPECRDQAVRSFTTPLAFRPVEWLLGESDFFAAERMNACRRLFEMGVIQPLVEHAAARFESEVRENTLKWSPDAVDALAQLIDIEVTRARGPAPREPGAGGASPIRSFQVEPMLRFVLGPAFDAADDSGPSVAAQAKQLQRVCDYLYRADQGGQDWPPPLRAAAPVKELVKHFNVDLLALKEAQLAALRTFHKREDELIGVLRGGQALDRAVWDARFQALESAKNEIFWLLEQHGQSLGGALDAAARSAYDRLLAAAEGQAAADVGSPRAAANEIGRTLKEGWRVFAERQAETPDLDENQLFALRSAMYGALNQELPFGDTAARLDDLESAGTSVQDAQLRGRFDAARKFVAEGVVDAFLQRLGSMEAEAIAAAVKEQSRTAGKAAERPPIPLVKRAYDDRFDPRFALGLFRDWARIAKGQPAKRSAAAARETIGAYADRYLMYWSEGVVQETEIDAASWKLFLQNLGRHDPRDFAVNLTQLARSAVAELENLKAALAPLDERHAVLTAAEIDQRIAEVQQALALDVNARSNFDKLLRRWRELDGDVARVRPGIKDLRAETFLQEFGRTPESYGSFVDRFWARFAVSGLSLLARGAAEDADRAWQGLAPMRRFPLAPFVEGGRQFASEEVATAAELASRIVIYPEPDEPRPSGGDARDVHHLLQLLRSPLPEADELRRVQQMLAALPRPGDEPLRAEVFVHRDRKPSRGFRPAEDLWRYLHVVQEGQQNRVEWVGSTGAIGAIRYPGPELRLRLLETDAAGQEQNARELRFEGPWAAFDLLWPGARRDETDPHKWLVEVTVLDAQGKPRSIWLQIVFDSVVPAMDDWPKWADVAAAGAEAGR
jgi:hypothetical protein